MFHVTIFDAAGTPLVVEVSHEVFQVFAEYDREMERQRKEDFRHRDCRSWDTCLLFEVSTEPLEQTYERMRTLKEIRDALKEFSPRQRRRSCSISPMATLTWRLPKWRAATSPRSCAPPGPH